jgi:Cu2+-exporting ATPase
VELAKKAYRLIRQNLAWALLYNVIAVPAAVLGFLEPWHAALGMSLSSLLVVVNGLRLFNLKPADYELPVS